jgi:hypothetical protein
MGKTEMTYFLIFAKQNIWQLMSSLNIANYSLALEVNSQSLDISSETLRRCIILSKIIKGKSLQEREEYFLSEVRNLRSTIRQGIYELVEPIKDSLGYFQKAFLGDSKMRRVKMDTGELSALLDYKEQHL